MEREASVPYYRGTKGDNTAPNYHKYIPKSSDSIKMGFADILILALENKFMSFQRRQRDIKK